MLIASQRVAAQPFEVLTEADIDPTGECILKTSTLCNGVAGLELGCASASMHPLSDRSLATIYVNGTFPESALQASGEPIYGASVCLSSSLISSFDQPN